MRETVIPLEMDRITTRPQVESASFLSRAVAKTVDLVIMLVALALVDVVLGTTFVVHYHRFEGQSIVRAIFCFLVWFGYEVLTESSKRQATIGKRLMGIIVTDLEGNRINTRKAAVRCGAQAVSACLIVGYVLAAFTQRKQALHDLIAGTLVCPGTF